MSAQAGKKRAQTDMVVAGKRVKSVEVTPPAALPSCWHQPLPRPPPTCTILRAPQEVLKEVKKLAALLRQQPETTK